MIVQIIEFIKTKIAEFRQREDLKCKSASGGLTSFSSLVAEWEKKNINASIAAQNVCSTRILAQEPNMQATRCGNCEESSITILTWWREGSARTYYRFCLGCKIEYPV